jgi:hypothetical protein
VAFTGWVVKALDQCGIAEINVGDFLELP